MSSLVYDIGNKSRKVARFMGVVRREVQKAVAAEKATRKLTQQQIADMLETDKSVINREILGGNLTLRRLGELAWALGWEISFEFRKPVTLRQNHHETAPEIQSHAKATAGIVTLNTKMISATTSTR